MSRGVLQSTHQVVLTLFFHRYSTSTYCFTYLGNVYFSDDNNNRIRKVTVLTGIITTIAGSSTSDAYSGDNGAATSANLASPAGVAVDASGISILPFYYCDSHFFLRQCVYC